MCGTGCLKNFMFLMVKKLVKELSLLHMSDLFEGGIISVFIPFFSCPEQLLKSSRRSVRPLVRWSVGPSESFVKM